MDARLLGHDNIEVFLPEMKIYAISPKNFVFLTKFEVNFFEHQDSR